MPNLPKIRLAWFTIVLVLLASFGCDDNPRENTAEEDVTSDTTDGNDSDSTDASDQIADGQDEDMDSEPRVGWELCELEGDPPQNPESVILFGDLHAHTSNSLDGQLVTLPVFDRRPYGPDDACLFARYCAGLDFWSVNDHAEEMLPRHWRENIQAVRECNEEFGGYTHEPEMVSFVGWEWTQSTNDRTTDFGHHNVVLRDTCEPSIPARPIAAPRSLAGIDPSVLPLFRDIIVALDPDNADQYDAVVDRMDEFAQKPPCDPDVGTLDLPADCHEIAEEPADVYAFLEAWGLNAIAIPHGSAWGTHHTQRVTWRQRFNPEQLSPFWSPLMEIHSGHGNSEEYRDYRHADLDDNGNAVCPEPSEDFKACCWRAGELTREEDPACQADPASAECDDAVAQARAAFLAEGKKGFSTLPNATADDWLDCGQCIDCFQPALGLRPERTAQAALAMTNFDGAAPWRYIFGFVSSTDSHQSGPGAGYKEFTEMTDASGPAREEFETVVQQALRLITPDHTRQESFNYGGGLVAVHSEGRSRHAIWEALQARRVYATSGERIELHFNAEVNGTEHPMGAEVTTATAPTFTVSAKGGFVQAPGCDPSVAAATSPDFVTAMCFGECYNPTDERYAITRVEVVKITPQVSPDEELQPLIQDPWLVLPCDESEPTCQVTFTDDAYESDARPARYYVRAIQEPTLVFNADTLRCERDADGNCIDTNVCDAGYTGVNDDCLSEGEERAWSSPIYLSPE